MSLVRASSEVPEVVTEFQPQFTYPVVGESEQIYGYKGLDVDLRFAAHNLRPNVRISYDKKVKSVPGAEALDLNKTLATFLPPVAFETDFNSVLANDTAAKDYRPPGELVDTYTRNGKTYEIWAAPLSDPAMKELVDNIQILIVFFIEGGQFINLEDVDWTLDRWRVYLVYEKAQSSPSPSISPYSFVGYATTYRFFRFVTPKPRPNASGLDPYPPSKSIEWEMMTSRQRISQFLILPGYQRGGHGSALYQAIYSEMLRNPTIVEMTVEDPSEEFDKLRDVNDFKILRPGFEKAGIKINTEPFASADRGRIKSVPTKALLPLDVLKAIRKKKKIAGRQFSRQVEMYLLANIGFSHRAAGGANMTTLKVRGARNPDPQGRAYYWWRLLLKQRIMKKNKDLLLQVPVEDRISHIEDAARGQEDEYEGMILMYAASLQKEQERHGNGTGVVAESSTSRKRKVVDDDDDDEDTMSTDSKRPRV